VSYEQIAERSAQVHASFELIGASLDWIVAIDGEKFGISVVI
jgi:hypothetical protein